MARPYIDRTSGLITRQEKVIKEIRQKRRKRRANTSTDDYHPRALAQSTVMLNRNSDRQERIGWSAVMTTARLDIRLTATLIAIESSFHDRL